MRLQHHEGPPKPRAARGRSRRKTQSRTKMKWGHRFMPAGPGTWLRLKNANCETDQDPLIYRGPLPLCISYEMLVSLRDRNRGAGMRDIHSAGNANAGAIADIQHRLPRGLATTVIAALSVVSWATVIGLVAALHCIG